MNRPTASKKPPALHEVLVLGAGMIGVCTALQLARRGHSVCLVDRQAPGREASYGNAGIVQAEAMVPYPFPRDWATLKEAALRRGTAVHYHFAALPALLAPLLRYWHASAPARHERAIRGHSALIAQALPAHEALVVECGAQALLRRRGYHQAFRSARALDDAVAHARAMQHRFGVRHAVLDGAQLSAAEPVLQRRLAGAIHWPDPVAVVDPGALVVAYAQRLQALGGKVLLGDAATLAVDGAGWRVQAEGGPVRAEHAVIALGAWSAPAAARLGYRLPLFVKRGYHRHFTGGPMLSAPLLDAERGYVLAPMSQGMRLTTGAEFARLGAPATEVQLRRATAVARELLALPVPVEATPWLGNRPCLPDMLPVMGPAARHRNLWFNFGHAHQGFTLGPACGALMADLIEGREPPVDMAPYRAERFRGFALGRAPQSRPS
ncbi:MAG: NAD(P)/FAD-dependent oxidoreductase [Pseudomonadota bacterium]